MTRNFFPLCLSIAALICVPAELSAQNVEPLAVDSDTRNGQAIVTVYYSQSDQGFDNNGDVTDINDYNKFEVFLLAEYAVNDDLTLIFNPSFRDVSVEGGDNSTGLGYTAIGARHDVLEDEKGWVALEGTVRIPGVERADNLAQVGSTDMEYDVRARAFRNIKLGQVPGFIDAQGGYRFRDGDPPNEFHADLTVGIRPSPDWLLMAQSFSTISDGSGEGIFDEFSYHNVQLSAVKSIANGVSLQFGLVGIVSGRNALRERGAFGGIWIDF